MVLILKYQNAHILSGKGNKGGGQDGKERENYSTGERRHPEIEALFLWMFTYNIIDCLFGF